LSYQIGAQTPLLLPVDDSFDFLRHGRMMTPRIENFVKQTIPSSFVKSDGLDPKWMAQAWNNINLTNLHDDINRALRIIDGRAQQVSANFNEAGEALVPIVRLEGSPRPIVLRIMGDGMVRMFNIVLALVNSKGGILLVDEIVATVYDEHDLAIVTRNGIEVR
jgi:hypothetical protein